MNGATTEPWVITTSPPSRARTKTIGRSQYFFLFKKNFINSIKIIFAVLLHFTIKEHFFEQLQILTHQDLKNKIVFKFLTIFRQISFQVKNDPLPEKKVARIFGQKSGQKKRSAQTPANKKTLKKQKGFAHGPVISPGRAGQIRPENIKAGPRLPHIYPPHPRRDGSFWPWVI